MNCPLPDQDLHQGADALLRKCSETSCSYWRGDLDSDRLPGGCVLLVVALLDPQRPVKEKR